MGHRSSTEAISIGQKRVLSLFFMLLWGQLIFSAGMSMWRTKLIVLDNHNVFPGNISPGIGEFIAFAEENCPADSAVAYISSKYHSSVMARYDLYPMPVSRWKVDMSSSTAMNDLESRAKNTVRGSQIPLCLFVDHLGAELPEMGERIYLNSEQYLVVLSE